MCLEFLSQLFCTRRTIGTFLVCAWYIYIKTQNYLSTFLTWNSLTRCTCISARIVKRRAAKFARYRSSSSRKILTTPNPQFFLYLIRCFYLSFVLFLSLLPCSYKHSLNVIILYLIYVQKNT